MDRGAWQAAAYGVTEESDMTDWARMRASKCGHSLAALDFIFSQLHVKYPQRDNSTNNERGNPVPMSTGNIY